MYRKSLLAALVAVVSLGSPPLASAQSLLEQAADPVQPGAGAAAPDSGAQTEASPTASDGIYLGLIGNDAEDNGRGVRVLEVRGKSPAERGGLRAKDLITGIGDQPVGNLDDMDRALDTNKPGDRVEFKIVRDGGTQTLRITLGTRPQEPAPEPEPRPTPGPKPPLPEPEPPLPKPEPIVPPLGPVDPAPSPPPLTDLTPDPREAPPVVGNPSLGVTVKDVTPELRASQGLGVHYGAAITAIRSNSPAKLAGIPVGAVIVAVNGRRINTADDLVTEVRAAEAGQEIEVTYVVGERQRRAQLKLTGSAPTTPADVGPTVAPPSLPGAKTGVEDLAAPGMETAPAGTADAADVSDLKQAIKTMRSQIELLQQRLSELEARLQTMEKPPR